MSIQFERFWFRHGQLTVHALISTHSDPVTRAAVLLHGFGGGPLKTWKQFPRCLDDTSSAYHQSTDYFFIGYDSIETNVYVTSDRVRHLLDSLVHNPMDFLEEHAAGFQLIRTRLSRRIAYQELVLVGHSLGGVIFRKLILDRVSEMLADNVSPVETLTCARLLLLAPAIGGVLLSGLRGVLFELGISLRALCLISASPTFQELQPQSTLLTTLRSDTRDLAVAHADCTGLRARILWGEKDRVVASGCKYLMDAYQHPVDDATHSSLPRPSWVYTTPLVFLETGSV